MQTPHMYQRLMRGPEVTQADTHPSLLWAKIIGCQIYNNSNLNLSWLLSAVPSHLLLTLHLDILTHCLRLHCLFRWP
jgi:hypothetical protein